MKLKTELLQADSYTADKMTAEKLQKLWTKYADRLENDADPDVIRADYYEELGRLGGIPLHGRGAMNRQEADTLLGTLKERGCAVLDDPAHEGEDVALVLFLPEEIGSENPVAANSPTPQGQGRRGWPRMAERPGTKVSREAMSTPQRRRR